MRGEVGGLRRPEDPCAAWPARMSLEECSERREGRMRVRSQRRPFQRSSDPPREVTGGERGEARGVAC